MSRGGEGRRAGWVGGRAGVRDIAGGGGDGREGRQGVEREGGGGVELVTKEEGANEGGDGGEWGGDVRQQRWRGGSEGQDVERAERV